MACNYDRYPHDCGGDARGFQVAVHIIQKLPSWTKVGEHARALFDHHGVGYPPCDNGLLLLLAIGDRKSYIRTGNGTQRVVTKGMVSDMLDDARFKHEMRAQNYAGGVQYILDQITSPLQQNQPTPYYEAQRASQARLGVLIETVFWALMLSGFCFFYCPLAEVSVNVATAVDGAAVAVVSTLLATGRMPTFFVVFVGALAFLRFAFCRHRSSERDADFRTKLQRLQHTHERNAKVDGICLFVGNVTTAPCAICLEELPEGLNFSCSDCDSAAKILRCGHVFHEACIDTWVSSGGNNGCPICRKKSPRFTASHSSLYPPGCPQSSVRGRKPGTLLWTHRWPSTCAAATAFGCSQSTVSRALSESLLCRGLELGWVPAAVGGRKTMGESAAGDEYSRTRPALIDDEYYAGYYKSLGRRYRDVPGAVRMHQRDQTWSSCMQSGGRNFNLCAYYDASEARFKREQELKREELDWSCGSGDSGGSW